MLLCILLCMANTSTIRDKALSIARIAKAAGINQVQLASVLGASQPQISRILSGHISRPSRLFREICVYVRSVTQGITVTAVRENNELIEALAETWDGTARHASSLAAVIRALGALQENPRNQRRGPSPKEIRHAD